MLRILFVRRSLLHITLRCMLAHHPSSSLFFFFNAPATTEIYTLSLHDALPIWFAFDVHALFKIQKADAEHAHVMQAEDDDDHARNFG